MRGEISAADMIAALADAGAQRLRSKVARARRTIQRGSRLCAAVAS